MLAADDGERARLAQEFDRHLPGGVIAHLKAPRPKQLFPLLRDDIDAVHIPGTARVDGRRLRDALLHGVEHRAGTRDCRGACRTADRGSR